jgi:UPF0755 protein
MFKNSFLKKIIFLVVFLLVLGSSFVGIGSTYWFQRPQKNQKTVVFIEKGSSLTQIATRLYDEGVLDLPFLFKAILLCTGEWQKLKAGEYLIPASVTPAQLIRILKSGKGILHSFTLVEGETSHHLAQKLAQDSRFEGVFSYPVEGSLLPETYAFPRGTKRQVIINHMEKEMARVVEKLWASRPKDSPLKTPEELVILASIVERETALSRERPIVAAVFLNRIKEDMMLQADPTILYALTQGKDVLGRDLSLEDLKVESAHNTYLYKGLPPTPIANPGILSLKAVMSPSEVPYLYFVADGKGGHVFATTLEEHQANHNAWRKIRGEKSGSE